MPRIVDHEARRRDVVQFATTVIATSGVDGMTVRSVAEAAGCSTTVVSHYFVDKRDLLLATYRASAARATARFNAAERGTSADPLRACLESVLPLDSARRRDVKVWFAFWGVAGADREFAAVQRNGVRSVRRRLERMLRAETPTAVADDVVGLAAASVLALTQGISLQALFDPRAWPASQQRRALLHALTATRAELAAGAPARANKQADARNVTTSR